MKQAPGFDGLSFDPFSLFEDGLAASEVDIGRGEVLQALVVSPVVVVFDEGIDLLPEIAGKIVVFQQNAVLQGLVPALDLALRLGMIRRTAGMLHAFVLQPFCQISRDVTGAIVAEEPWLVDDVNLIAA